MNFKSTNKEGKQDEIRFALAEAQNWICPLSKIELKLVNGRVIDPTTNKAISVDHDHETGLIRGVLVQKLNWLVGGWEKEDYGEAPKPDFITEYQNNPPAFDSIGKLMYHDYWIQKKK